MPLPYRPYLPTLICPNLTLFLNYFWAASWSSPVLAGAKVQQHYCLVVSVLGDLSFLCLFLCVAFLLSNRKVSLLLPVLSFCIFQFSLKHKIPLFAFSLSACRIFVCFSPFYLCLREWAFLILLSHVLINITHSSVGNGRGNRRRVDWKNKFDRGTERRSVSLWASLPVLSLVRPFSYCLISSYGTFHSLFCLLYEGHWFP